MNRKTTKKVDESTLTTLCAVCRGAFLDAKGVHLRRADPRQLVKDVCTYCQTRYGFDYYVQPIVRKSKMTGKENRRETEPAYDVPKSIHEALMLRKKWCPVRRKRS